MSDFTYDVIECNPGPKNLRKELGRIEKDGQWEVVSVVPNTGGTLFSVIGSGEVLGLMIVVKRPKL